VQNCNLIEPSLKSLEVHIDAKQSLGILVPRSDIL